MIPVYLGIQLAVAYLFAYHIFVSPSKQICKKIIWLIVMIMIMTLGFWSCTRYINAEKGWNKGNLGNIPMAQVINSYTSPLINFTIIFLWKPSQDLLEIVESNTYSIDKTYKKLGLTQILHQYKKTE